MKTIIFFLLMVVSQSIFGQIESYSFHGVKLGDTTEQMQSVFPGAEQNEDASKPNLGLYNYTVMQIGGVDVVIFYVYNDRIYKIRLGYLTQTVNSLGGWQSIVHSVVDKYGDFDKRSNGTSTDDDNIAEFLWDFPKQGKHIGLVVNKVAVIIDFVDDKLTKQMQKSVNSQMGF